MFRSLQLSLAVLLLADAFASGLLVAQARLPASDFHMLSGSDVGFRVEGTDSNGRPIGRWMVRVEGRWTETAPAAILRRATD
jgi:hypothetical protein